MTAPRPKILCVRLDKIGDLVSTLPVDDVFRRTFPEGRIQWVIAKGLGFLPEHSLPRRDYKEVSLDPAGRETYREYLRNEQPDMVVIYYAPWWAAYEAFRAGIAIRVGRKSQWFSFLLFTSGLRQSRSLSEKHEADYNFELAQFARQAWAAQNPNVKLPALWPVESTEGLTAEERERRSLLKNDLPLVTPVLQLKAASLRQLFERFRLQRGRYVVVHPGMAGSALNWPTKYYVELIQGILQRDDVTQVLITGTKMDEAWTTPILAAFKEERRVVSAVNSADLRELLFLLEGARAVVVPSTGVAHLAASLGTPTRAIYSPVLAHSAKRWGPRGPDVKVFEPAIPGSDQGLMHKIEVQEVLDSIPHLGPA
jgi:heptosyltransferase I